MEIRMREEHRKKQQAQQLAEQQKQARTVAQGEFNPLQPRKPGELPRELQKGGQKKERVKFSQTIRHLKSFTGTCKSKLNKQQMQKQVTWMLNLREKVTHIHSWTKLQEEILTRLQEKWNLILQICEVRTLVKKTPIRHQGQVFQDQILVDLEQLKKSKTTTVVVLHLRIMF